jgi:hypothetical protein
MELSGVKSVFSMGHNRFVLGLFSHLDTAFRLLSRLSVCVVRWTRFGDVHLVCLAHSTCRSF